MSGEIAPEQVSGTVACAIACRAALASTRRRWAADSGAGLADSAAGCTDFGLTDLATAGPVPLAGCPAAGVVALVTAGVTAARAVRVPEAPIAVPAASVTARAARMQGRATGLTARPPARDNL